MPGNAPPRWLSLRWISLVFEGVDVHEDVPGEVCCVVGPVASEVADAFAAKASGATCSYEVDHGFFQLVREQEAAKDCCRVGHLNAIMMREDHIEWACCDDGCLRYLHDNLYNKRCDKGVHMSKTLYRNEMDAHSSL